jgi:Zn-dependent protease
MEELNTIQKIAVMALPLVFAIVLHEVAHGWVADKLGDHTARDMGRLTLNPIPHIDLFGTIIMPILLFVITSGRFVFGSAKPVPINPYNFKNPKKDMALSSLAGPAANLVMAVVFTFLLRIVIAGLEGKVPQFYWDWLIIPLSYMLVYGIIINVVLAVLNLIPIPPLDGSRVVYWLLPDKQAASYYRLEPYGMFIILALFAFGFLGRIMTPIVSFLLTLLLGEKVF